MERLRVHPLSLTSPASPFGHDPQRSTKSPRSHAPPQVGTIARSFGPLLIQPRQMGFQRALPNPEHIAAFTAQNPANQAATVPGAPYDLLDGDPFPCFRQNGSIGFLPMKIPLILQALRRCQQGGVYGHGTDGPADLAHRPADRVKKCVAGILHQVPAVCDLDGVRQGLCGSTRIRPAAIASDDGDLGLGGKPSLSRCRFSIREQADRFASFQIADDRSVSMISPPRPVIDTDDIRRGPCRTSAPAYHPQQGVIADGEPQPPGKARSRPTSQSKCEMVDKAVEATSTPSPWRQRPSSELLGENLLSTLPRRASETANAADQMYRCSCQWQIGDPALIAAMNPQTFLSASRTKTRLGRTAYRNGRSIVIAERRNHREAGGDER